MEANLTRLIAVRHGETAWNVDTRIQGHLDIGLNATGLWQAQRAGQALADEPIAAVYASDLSRAWQTAQAIAARHPGQLVVLVAHGGVMDVLYRAATRQELQAPRTWQLGNAAINRMLWTPEGFSLVGWSDIAHLATDAPLDETTT